MAFAPAGAVGGNFGFTSSRIVLSTAGAGAILRLVNMGSCAVSVKLGDGTVTVTQSTGTVVMPGQTEYFTIGANTNIAGVAAGGPGNTSTVNLSTGAVA